MNKNKQAEYFEPEIIAKYKNFEFELGRFPNSNGVWFSVINFPSMEFVNYIFGEKDMITMNGVNSSIENNWLGQLIYNSCKSDVINHYLTESGSIQLGIPIGLIDKLKEDKHEGVYSWTREDAIKAIHDVIDGICVQEICRNFTNNH